VGLKLTFGKGDKIIMSDGVVIDYLAGSPKDGGQVTLEFEAPKDIRIHTVFGDSRKQFKNRRRQE
jgi:sRNA-binding carbon storage regulator CsrA